MEQKLRLSQVDCAPSKEGGLLVSLLLRPEGAGTEAPVDTNGKTIRRRRRRKKVSSEQALELARVAIDQAVAEQEASETASRGSATAPRWHLERKPRRPPLPG
jgi:hypothetical protein